MIWNSGWNGGGGNQKAFYNIRLGWGGIYIMTGGILFLQHLIRARRFWEE